MSAILHSRDESERFGMLLLFGEAANPCDVHVAAVKISLHSLCLGFLGLDMQLAHPQLFLPICKKHNKTARI